MDVESKCSHLESVYFETMIRQPEEKYDPSSFMKTEYFLQNGINFSHASLRRRRSRTNFSSWQLLRLESTFQRHHYPDVHACQDLTKELGLSGSTVQVCQTFFSRSISNCHAFEWDARFFSFSHLNFIINNNS